MLTYLLLSLNTLVCIGLIVVVLLQRSEGGSLGGGSGPTGLITTRGVGDLLTKTTWGLFAAFLCLSMALTVVGAQERSSKATIDRLKLLSINPDTMAKKATSAAPASAPAAPSPTVQLPGTPAPTQAPPNAFTTPKPVVNLPPIGSSTGSTKP